MSRMNIESLLKVGESQGLRAPSAGSPEFKEGSIRGGQVQIGRPAQQIGPTSEEAMYGALAEMAGGLQKGIDIFSQIRSQIEKQEIAQARNKYKEIFTGEYFEETQPDGTAVRKFKDPSQKLNEWNNYIKDVWTPLLGSDWIDEINMEAYSAFGSREAQEKFEAERYQREAIQFFADPKNRTRLNQNSPIARMEFDSYYLSKYPTASGNAWFVGTQQENISKHQTEQTNFAIQSLEESLNLILPKPSEEQMAIVATGGTSQAEAIIAEHNTFFQEVLPTIRMAKDPTEASQILYKFYRKRLIEDNPNGYTPDTLVVLDKHLKGIVRRQATEMMGLKTVYNVTQQQQTANQALVTSDEALRADPSRESGTRYLSSVRLAAINSGKSPAEQQLAMGSALSAIFKSFYDENSQRLRTPITRRSTDFFYSVIQHESFSIFDKLNKELPKGESKDLSLLSPNEQFEVVSLLMLEEILNDPYETEQMMTILGVKTIPEFIDRYRVLVKSQLIVSPDIKEANTKWYAAKQESTTRVRNLIQEYGTKEEIEQQVNIAIELRAKKTDLPANLLRSIYFADGNYNPDFDINQWYQNLSPENKTIVDSSLNGTNLEAINNAAKEAYAIEEAARKRFRELEKEETAGIKEAEEEAAKRLEDAQGLSRGFIFAYDGNVKPEHTGGSLVSAVASGKTAKRLIKNKDEQQATARIQAYALALNGLQDVPLDENGEYIVEPNSEAYGYVQVLKEHLRFKYSLLPEDRANAEIIERSARVLNNAVSMAEGRLYSPFINLMEERNKSLGLKDTRDQLTTVVDGYRKRFREKFLNGDVSYNGTYNPDNAFDERGQLSYETFEYLMLTSLVVKDLAEAHDTGVGKSVTEELGTMFKNLTSQIAANPNPEEFLRNPENIMPYLGFVIFGQELRTALESSPQKAYSGANWFGNRLAMSASLASGINISDAVDYFTSEEFRIQASYTYDLPFLISYISKEQADAGVGATMGTAEDQINKLNIIPFQPAVLAAIGLQQTDATNLAIQTGNTEAINTSFQNVVVGANYGPEHPSWQPDLFFEAWQIAGLITEGVTKDQFASDLKEAFLRGSVANVDSLSTDEILRLGAQVLDKLNTGESKLVEDVIRIAASKQVGIGSQAYPLSENQTFEREFFPFLAGAAGVMQAARTQAISDPSVTKDNNGRPVNFNNSRANQTFMQSSQYGFDTVFSINSDTKDNSYYVEDTVRFVERLNPEYLLEQNLQHSWTPRTTIVKNQQVIRDRTPYQAGTAVLESLPQANIIATMIQPYIGEVISPFSGINLGNYSVITRFITDSVKDSKTIFEALQKLNGALVEFGFPPLINTENLYQKDGNGQFTTGLIPGSSEMVQNTNTGMPEEMAFTYSWAIVGLNGRPRIHLPNGIFNPNVLQWRDEFRLPTQQPPTPEEIQQKNKERQDQMSMRQYQLMGIPARGF